MAVEITNKIEREYVIPLREKCRPVPRYKKTSKAIKTIKEFLARHMKVYDRDLNKIKMDIHLNEFLWSRGIKNPPHSVKVRAIKTGDIVNVELVQMPQSLAFKKARLQKRELKALENVDKKKSLMQKAKESIQKGKTEDKSEEIKKEIEEKIESSIESEEKHEKQMAKEKKHETKSEKNSAQKKKEHSKGDDKR
jgi:ribosomal protein L31E